MKWIEFRLDDKYYGMETDQYLPDVFKQLLEQNPHIVFVAAGAVHGKNSDIQKELDELEQTYRSMDQDDSLLRNISGFDSL